VDRDAFSGNRLGALKQVLHTVAEGLVIIRVLVCGIGRRMLTLMASQSAGARHDVVETVGRQLLPV